MPEPEPGTPTSDGGPTIRASPRDDMVVLVPAYRESRGIGSVIEELRGTIDPRIVVIIRPDGDGTEAAARARGVLVVCQGGRGKGDAVRLGLDYVWQHYDQTRYIGLIDADCTYPSAAMEPMRQILETAPEVGMVIARRDNLSNDGIPSRAFAFGNRVLARVHQMINRIPVKDPLSGLRLIKADLLRGWQPRSRGFDIECELNDYVRNVKHFEIGEVGIPYRPRVGEKKLRLRHGILILGRMIRLAFRWPSPGRSPTPREVASYSSSSR